MIHALNEWMSRQILTHEKKKSLFAVDIYPCHLMWLYYEWQFPYWWQRLSLWVASFTDIYRVRVCVQYHPGIRLVMYVECNAFDVCGVVAVVMAVVKGQGYITYHQQQQVGLSRWTRTPVRPDWMDREWCWLLVLMAAWRTGTLSQLERANQTTPS